MTLAEFLLARVAEDEETVNSDARAISRPHVSGIWLNSARYLVADPARVLAECEAKRRIVERCLELDPTDVHFGGQVPHLHAQGLLEAVAWLALPYADHADYRDGWRP